MQCYLHRRRIVEQVARDVGVHEDANYGSRSESREKRRPRAHRNNSQRGPASDHPPGEADDERFVVRSTGDGDPLDPRNWPLLLRCQNIAVMILLLFGPAWAGGAPALANSAARQEFGVSATAENLATALYLLGIGSGALFLAGPISETVGRTAAYLVPGACYLLFVAGSAMTPTFGGQLACRFLVGLFGSVTLSINGSSVRDQFRPVKRAFVFPVVAWANVVRKFLSSKPPCLSEAATRLKGQRRQVQHLFLSAESMPRTPVVARLEASCGLRLTRASRVYQLPC